MAYFSIKSKLIIKVYLFYIYIFFFGLDKNDKELDSCMGDGGRVSNIRKPMFTTLTVLLITRAPQASPVCF